MTWPPQARLHSPALSQQSRVPVSPAPPGGHRPKTARTARILRGTPRRLTR